MFTYFIAPRIQRQNNDCPFAEHIGVGPSRRLTTALVDALASCDLDVSLGPGRNLIIVRSIDLTWEMRIRPWAGTLMGAPGIILVPLYRGMDASEAWLHALGANVREITDVLTGRLGVSVAVAFS